MAIGEDTTKFLVSTPRAWQRLSDFSRWKEWLAIPDARDKGLGNDLRVLTGEKTEMKLGMFAGDIQMQTFNVTQWDPPRLLAIEIDGWNLVTAAIQTDGEIKPGRGGVIYATIKALKFSCTAELTPEGESESQIRFRVEAYFTDPIGGLLFNATYPMRRTLQKIAVKFNSNFIQSF